MSYVPSQEQVAAHLRILIPMLGTAATAYGVSQPDATSAVNLAIAAIGPISYVFVAIWSGISNTRESIMRKASKAVAPGVPPPVITLPKEEAALAEKLPDNVVSK